VGTLPLMSDVIPVSQEMARYYWGSLFIGLMIYQTASCLNFLITKVLEKNKAIRHRAFYVCLFTTIVFIPHCCTSSAVADFMITLPEFAARMSPSELNSYLTSIALPGLYRYPQIT
jgi:hypothetical protein